MINILFVLVLAAFIKTWIVVGSQWSRGIEPVPYEPRRPVPWDGPATLFIVAFYLVGQIAAPVFAKWRYEYDTGIALDLNLAGGNQEFLVYAFSAHVVANAVLFIFGATLLMAWHRATFADVGLSLRRFTYDAKLAVMAFIMIVPPVLLLQAFLSWMFSPSTHPLLEALRQSKSPELVVWSIVAAVGAAPLVEEFFFRVVLQGWFEKLFAKHPPAEADTAVVADMPTPETLPVEASEPPAARPSFAPIIVSSLLFAFAHLGNGPDPIPLFFLALGLGYLYRQTHRAWPGILLHFFLNSFSTIVVIFTPPE